MQLPSVNSIEKTRDMVNVFMGYFHNDTVNTYAANQFYEMKNLSSDAYPSLTTRKERSILKKLTKGNGLYAFEKLAYVDGTDFFYDGIKVADVSDSEKVMVSMGAYIIVFPDKIMYSTETGEVEKLEFGYKTENDIMYTMCRLDGEAYEYYTGVNEPDTESWKYWLDVSAEPQVFKMWSDTQSEWIEVTSTYTKIQEMPDVYVNEEKILNVKYIEPSEEESVQGDYWLDLTDDTLYVFTKSGDITQWVEETTEYRVFHKEWGNNISEYDGVQISGSYNGEINNSMIIYGAGIDYIIVAAIIDEVHIQGAADNLTIERLVPDMDFVCEQDNRLWGCSSEKHEIYACKLGDPKNWSSYAGLTSDSYVVTVGTKGDFTGCVSHMGYVLFFKEDCIHKLYGTAPANYTISTVQCRGVQKGSEKSLCVINEHLYYKSTESICVYDGSLPTEISEDLGKDYYQSAVAGKLNEKYYVWMQGSSLGTSIFVYDIKKGMWHREDSLLVKNFAFLEGGLYYLDDNENIGIINKDKLYLAILPGMEYEYSEGKEILQPGDLYPGKEVNTETEVIEWEAVTNILGMDIADNKYVSNITLRLIVEKDSEFCVAIEYNSEEVWEDVLSMNATTKRSYTIPIRVRRCDHFRLRFYGKGSFRLFSYAKTIETGSEW